MYKSYRKHKKISKSTRNKRNRHKRRYKGGTISLFDNYNQISNIFKTQPLNISSQPFIQ